MKYGSEKQRSTWLAVPLSWLLALAIAGPAGAQKPPANDAPKTVQIVIDKVAFADVKVPLRVGDTIEWINKDVVDHTATAKNKDWDVQVPVGKKARLVLKKAGTIEYFCRYHPNMIGRMVVGK